MFMEMTGIRYYDSLDSAVSAVFGEGVKITEKTACAGGDINRAYAVMLSDGSTAFMKENSADRLDFFVKEIMGLNALVTFSVSVVTGLARGRS